MADIDSSLYSFCSNISKKFKVCISGECSDEIFLGYPWMYRKGLIDSDTFPFSNSCNLRSNLIKKGLLKNNELKNYINDKYNFSISKIEYIDKKDKFENLVRKNTYLTIQWFMTVLLERSDKMSMANSLEVRVPFADYRIFEYVYNLPAYLKLGFKKGTYGYNDNFDEKLITEKYLLRKAFLKDLPDEIINRKKSPFPKTYDPNYLKLLEETLTCILNSPNNKINTIINVEYVKNLINTHGKILKENFFGQLMTYPQTIAYIIQISMWLDYYDIQIDI